MTNIQEQQMALLESTVAFYGEDPERRSVNRYEPLIHSPLASAGLPTASCLYHGRDGRRCAVGRFIPDEKYSASIEGLGAGVKRVFSLLPESVQALGVDFIEALQSVHDDERNWHRDGLSFFGKEIVSIMRKAISAGYY